METTTNKLKMQLKSAQSELEQTRNTLKSMEGSDGHAMKVAMGMQKQITAKRGQIDALQSKIQFLEEAMTNANKVSPCPRSGGSQHVHSLIYFMTERHSRDTNYSGEKKRGYF